METAESPLVVGVFRDHALAQQAVDELRHAGFRNDQIWYVGQGGGLLASFKPKFAEGEDEMVRDRFVEQGVPDEDTQYYQQEFEAGRTLVIVQAYGHQQKARSILDQFGAYHAGTNPSRLKDVHSIQLREEVLEAHKQPVETGEVFIRKVIVTEEKTITVPVIREEIVIERRSVSDDQPASQAAARLVELGENEIIRIPLRTEQVLIEKRPVVTEEVLVSKRNLQETRRFSDTVRREEARLERQGNVTIHGDRLEEAPQENRQEID